MIVLGDDQNDDDNNNQTNKPIFIFGIITKVDKVQVNENLQLPFVEIASKCIRNIVDDIPTKEKEHVDIIRIQQQVAAPFGKKIENLLNIKIKDNIKTVFKKINLNLLAQNDLLSISIANNLPRRKFFETFNSIVKQQIHSQVSKNKMYVFRITTDLLGHNAPLWSTYNRQYSDEKYNNRLDIRQQQPNHTKRAWLGYCYHKNVL